MERNHFWGSILIFLQLQFLRFFLVLLMPSSLLICTLRSDFEGGRKVVPQNWIFFWVYTINSPFFQLGDPENLMSLFHCTALHCTVNGTKLLHTVMRAIISRGLYIFYPISKDHFFVFRWIFQKILSLCMACIQERLLIKSGLWWRAYGILYTWKVFQITRFLHNAVFFRNQNAHYAGTRYS